MPSASNGPFQATGTRSSPSRAERSSPRGKPRVPRPSRLAATCAKGVCVGASRPSTTATATPPAEAQAPDRPRPSPPGLISPCRSPCRGPSRAAALLWSSAGGSHPQRGRRISYLVDPASSHMLVSKIKPCMSKYRPKQGETANGSLNQLWFIGSYPFLLG